MFSLRFHSATVSFAVKGWSVWVMLGLSKIHFSWFSFRKSSLQWIGLGSKSRGSVSIGLLSSVPSIFKESLVASLIHPLEDQTLNRLSWLTQHFTLIIFGTSSGTSLGVLILLFYLLLWEVLGQEANLCCENVFETYIPWNWNFILTLCSISAICFTLTASSGGFSLWFMNCFIQVSWNCNNTKMSFKS